MTDQLRPQVPDGHRTTNVNHGNSGITFNGGRDVRVGDHSNIVNGDQNDNSTHHDNSTHLTFKQRHPAAFALLVLAGLGLVGGGVAAVSTGGGGGGSGVDTSVVNEPGARGASDTVGQIRVAEKDADAAAWCAMVAPTDGGCAKEMSGQFQRTSSTFRGQTDKVGVGTPQLGKNSAQVPLSWNGKEQGTVPLVWSGGRWQMSGGDASMVQLAGGVFLSLVEEENGQLSLGGIPLP
ncbi:hypothetical protein K7472_27760 [Streptomyces sp. PTM05]|uniref:Uncharacterized protein n=1 Tax=Streptantibioticus parmotrematis TaxID=2873249 RepID=A0ABS7QZH5_9ACTN|nr:hypothetical protein [Streptantibioticus parmotrematis]MBY8888610.1 hypothetical protein [Streptantibioticus parmotrematis]